MSAVAGYLRPAPSEGDTYYAAPLPALTRPARGPLNFDIGMYTCMQKAYKGGDVYFFKSPILQFEGLKIDLFGKNLMKCITYIQDSSKIYAFLTYNI